MKHIILALFITFSLNSQAQLTNTLSPAQKVYGLSRFWQEVNYNFVYLDKVDRQKWDSSYISLIDKVQATPNDYEYYRELQKFCALLKDGHTNIYFPQTKGFEQFNTMFGDYRLFIENIDNKPIVVRTNLSRKNEIPVGSEIIMVNGLTANQHLEEDVLPYISSSTDYVLRDWGISRLLQGLEGERYIVKVKRPKGDTITLNLVHSTTNEKEVYPEFEPQKNLLDFKWYPGGMAYVSLNSFGDEKIDSMFEAILPELYKAKSIIIDLRYNGGGSTSVGTEILKYLTTDSVLYGSKYTSRLHIPSFKAWGKFASPSDTVGNAWSRQALLSFQDKYFHEFEYSPDTFRVKGKRILVPTAILIGHNTASAAEDFLIYADRQKHMTKIGENTFGSTGQPYMFDLPGGGSARVCTKKDTYPDGREFVGYGIKPDIEVKRTVNDYLTGKDPVLQKAIDFLKKKTK